MSAFANAKWIFAGDAAPIVDRYYDYRQSFSVSGSSTLLHISAHTNYAVYVNGVFVKDMLWSDFTADISGFVKSGETARISVEVVVGNRNLFGPHYTFQGESYECSPAIFAPHGKYTPNWWRDDRICFVKAGLGE